MNIIHESSYRASATKWLQQQGYPFTDYLALKNSTRKFDNDALFGIEMPVINSYEILKKTIECLDYYGLHCDRFNETRGSFFLPDEEIKDMLSLCKERNIGITFSLSPRPEYDTKATFYRSKFGLEQCRRLNNHEAITSSIEEAIRLAELGCRGLIIYDIGVLRLLSEMRQQGVLPKNMLFKASSHCMATNPIIANILHQCGADSVTVIHDANLIVLQEMRRLSPNLILDVPIDTYADKGGFVRFNELADIVKIASPVILKLGASAQKSPYDNVNDAIIKERVKLVLVAIQYLKKFLQEKDFKKIPPKYCAIPETKK